MSKHGLAEAYSKIALGTVQFGMDYGINNKRGRIPLEETFEILHEAVQAGIDTFDTAGAYGQSEEILGEYIKKNKCTLKIVTKLSSCGFRDVEDLFHASLKRLHSETLYGYLVHDFSSYQSDKRIWDILLKFKSEGRIKKIGFSLYNPKELEDILKDNVAFDMIQVPFSIFDQRFFPYFESLKARKIEIYARSVFLQGLVFIKPEQLDEYFLKMKVKLQHLNKLSEESGIPIVAMCLNFSALSGTVDKVVVGIDSIVHLKEIGDALDNQPKVKDVISRLYALREDDEKILLPYHWSLKSA